jgi:hypothetical protein
VVKRERWLIGAALLAALALLVSAGAAEAQGGQPTPIPLVISTRTPTLPPTSAASPSNVRSTPDTSGEGNILGKIFPGTFYAVIGRRERWLQIRYDKAPNGKGWVYDGVVDVYGVDDPVAIPTIAVDTIETLDPRQAAQNATARFITATPGAPETATVLARSATGIFTATNQPGTPNAADAGVIVTFTYPPPRVEATLPPRGRVAAAEGELPPIIPLIALGGLGLFGLFVSLMRRL